MRSHRGGWLGSSIVAATLVLLPAASTVRAQPGFGPDPFWPYNNQYTPYVSPVGPADPQGGQGVGGLFQRNGLRNANQFQDYLESIQGGGPGRAVSDRSNVGMPYYRSAVDPSFETRGRGPRQYVPNLRANQTFEQSQRNVADIYFRYYEERDPARRSEFLREYRLARREAAQAISGRGRSPSRVLDSSTRMEAGSRRGNRPGSDRAHTRAGAGDDRFGPAPEVPPRATRRSAGPATPPRTSPSDVLERSRAMDRQGRGVRPSPGSPQPSSPPRGGEARGTSPIPPATGEDNP